MKPIHYKGHKIVVKPVGSAWRGEITGPVIPCRVFGPLPTADAVVSYAKDSIDAALTEPSDPA